VGRWTADPVNPDARAALPEVRRMISDGKYADAVRLVTEKVLARPVRQMPYQPLGDLWLTFPAVPRVDGYRRSLNLETAVATTAFEAGGVRFSREVFSSAVDVIVVLDCERESDPVTAALTTAQNATVTPSRRTSPRERRHSTASAPRAMDLTRRPEVSH
jgi:alpha-L-fucosidase 2